MSFAFRNIKSIFSTHDKNDLFEYKIFRIILILAAFNCFFAIGANTIINTSFWVNLLLFLGGIAFCVFFYLSHFRGINKPLVFPFKIMVGFLIVICWLYFQGMEGSTPFFLFMALFLIIYSDIKKNYWFTLIYLLFLSVVLVCIGLYFPQWIHHYPNKSTQTFDVVSGFLVSFSLSGYTVIVLKKHFDRERAATEQKKQELEISEGRFKDIALSSGDWLWEIDENSSYTYCSEKVEKILGYTSTEMIGKTPFEFMPKDEADKIRKEFLQISNERRSFRDLTNWNLTKTGQRVCILTSGVPIFDKQGNLTGYRGADTDITKRLETEKALREEEIRYRTLFENANDAIFTVKDDVFLDCNQMTMKMFGCVRKENIIGKHPWEFDLGQQPDGQDPALVIMERIQKAFNGNPQCFYWKHTTKNGKPFYTEISLNRIEVENSVLFQAIVRDITERKEAENRLKENETRLRELNATKDKFFSIIAHDLKSPFNAIVGFSDMLLDCIKGKDYEGIDEYAEIIQKSSSRALALLVNLIEWSRAQTGRMEFHPETVNLSVLIHEAVELANDAALQKSIHFIQKQPDVLSVNIDKAMIGTVLRNLLSNAIKFTPLRGTIVLSAECRQEETIVSINDNGIGISPENMDKLFRIEENFTTSGTNDEHGTGLGLLLCKEFITKHGGKIWVESELGKGSTFYFSIPTPLT